MKTDPIEEFMRQYGRIYEERLNPKDQQFVMDELARETGDSRTKPRGEVDQRDATTEAAQQDYQTWREMHASREDDPSKQTRESQTQRADALEDREPSETYVAKTQDPSKEGDDPSQSWTKAQQERTVEQGLPLVEEQALIERSWVDKVEDRAQASLWDSRGASDELKVMSAGQRSESWTNAIDPNRDMAAAARDMGLTPAIERQKAQEIEQQKGQERGGEGLERD